jgi:hypothetical protein
MRAGMIERFKHLIRLDGIERLRIDYAFLRFSGACVTNSGGPVTCGKNTSRSPIFIMLSWLTHDSTPETVFAKMQG